MRYFVHIFNNVLSDEEEVTVSCDLVVLASPPGKKSSRDNGEYYVKNNDEMAQIAN